MCLCVCMGGWGGGVVGWGWGWGLGVGVGWDGVGKERRKRAPEVSLGVTLSASLAFPGLWMTRKASRLEPAAWRQLRTTFLFFGVPKVTT